MAITTVVTNSFFEKLVPVLRDFDKDPEIGPLALAMLVPSAMDDNYRSLVLSSRALDAMSLSKANMRVRAKLRECLGEDAWKIDTISILRTRSSAVRILGESYDIPTLGTAYQAAGMAIMALGLDDAFLFLSKSTTALAA
jgi:hypothetical protein